MKKLFKRKDKPENTLIAYCSCSCLCTQCNCTDMASRSSIATSHSYGAGKAAGDSRR